MEREEFNPNKPTKALPKGVRALFSLMAKELLDELNGINSPYCKPGELGYTSDKYGNIDGRFSNGLNPEWYREMYYSYPHFRRDRTLTSLQKIIGGEDKRFGVSDSKYAPHAYSYRFRELVHERIKEELSSQGGREVAMDVFGFDRETIEWFGLDTEESSFDEVPF